MSNSLPGGSAANGTTAALERPANTPNPVINNGPATNPVMLAFALGKDGANGGRANTLADSGHTPETVVHS